MNQTKLLKYGAAVLKICLLRNVAISKSVNHILVSDELQHAPILNFIHIQRYCSHCNPYHGLGMIEEFYCFSVQGKVIGVFIVEKVDRVCV